MATFRVSVKACYIDFDIFEKMTLKYYFVFREQYWTSKSMLDTFSYENAGEKQTN